MASKKTSDFFCLPTMGEHANAVCGMWQLGVPKDLLGDIDRDIRAPDFGSPQDDHDRQRVAST
jgi:hypothetical protein